jgi:hypothetical protein
VDVPAPEEPVMAMTGCLADMVVSPQIVANSLSRRFGKRADENAASAIGWATLLLPGDDEG